MVAIHQALIRYLRASAMMLPKVGVGGWTPRPMKPRIASKIIMRATSSTATKAIGGRMLGANRQHDPQVRAPKNCAAADILLAALGDAHRRA